MKDRTIVTLAAIVGIIIDVVGAALLIAVLLLAIAVFG